MGKKIKKSKRAKGPVGAKAQDLDALFKQAIQCHQAGQLEQAIKMYKTVLTAVPDNASVCNLYGLALHSSGKLENALSLLIKATRLAPQSAKYHYDVGVILQQEGKELKSISYYRAALELDPQNVAAWENLGVALFDCGQNEEAIVTFENALKINPSSLLALTNLATLMRWQGEQQQTLKLLSSALEVDPVYIPAKMKQAEVFLSLGDYRQGWEEYSWRLTGAGRPGQDLVRYVPKPKWDGHSLDGKKLLLYTEQGIGDEVMFASCLPQLLEQKINFHFLCDPRMVTSFKRSFPELSVSANVSGEWGSVAESIDCDYRLPIGDLPKIFRPREESFSDSKSYLKADPVLLKHWQERLRELGDNLKVGISWRGGRQKYTQKARSADLEELSSLLKLPDLSFVNLQYGDCRKEISSLPKDLRAKITTFADIDPLVDLDSFFALITNLDLVITVDNSTVHFAGALGTPTWLLLPALADWRWPVEGTGSRWYPSVRLFRRTFGDSGSWRDLVYSLLPEVGSLLPKTIEMLDTEPAVSLKEMEHASVATTTTKKALFLNDTSYWYHWGCTCTSLAIRQELQERGWQVKGVPIDFLRTLPLPPASVDAWTGGYISSFKASYHALWNDMEQADVIVVNGEGSLHGGEALPLNLLFLMHVAKSKLGKPVHVINHSCYPDDSPEPTGSHLETLFQQVYSGLDTVAVREPVSTSLLEKLGLSVTQSFDCLPLFVDRYRAELSQKKCRKLMVAGSVAYSRKMLEAIALLAQEIDADKCSFLFGANAYPAADDVAVVPLLKNLLQEKFELIHAQSEMQWLLAIASSELFVSGRFHHTIAAACLETPFIVLESNTPKISGLMSLLELGTHINSQDVDFEQSLILLAKELLQAPEKGVLTTCTLARIQKLAQSNFVNLVSL